MPQWLDHLLDQHAPLLVAAMTFLGGVLGAVLTWLVNRRKVDSDAEALRRKADTEERAQLTSTFTQAIDGFKDLLAAQRGLLEDARKELESMRQCNGQLLARVAELQAEVTLHKGQIEQLKSENAALREEIGKLKARRTGRQNGTS